MNYRPQWLAEGIEDLLSALDQSADDDVDFDVVVVGSGYGGAVAAARLAQAAVDDKGTRLKLCVLERGQEYVPGTFPGGFSELPGCVRFSRFDDPEFKGTADGLFDFRLGADISVLVGNGLGGGSLINASVAERAKHDVFDDPAWPARLRRDLDTLDDCYYRAECMLGVSEAEVRGLDKYRALGEFAMAAGASVRPARIAVNFTGGVNAHGVAQGACRRTGNCVTGCNNWAKNTLAMNYLPLAKRFGARLFVNTTVMRVEKVARGDEEVLWQVRVRQTSKRHPQADQNRAVRARHVVLAAGTLGSTEILMRSRARDLRFSETLGTRFSGNGDMISALHGQRSRVNAAPEDAAPITRDVGPTITGVVEVGATRAERVVIEDLGIPSPLRRVFEEIVTTGALPAAVARFDWSTHRPGGPDPAAVDTDAIERTQIFAAMGDDGARGSLEMVEGWESAAGNGAIKVEWKGAGADPLYLKQDNILSKSESLGGTYLRNPLWRPLPNEVSDILSGRKPEGKLLSVHPLGGCAMGDDWKTGVVDDIGRVYDPAQRGDYTRTHHGLLVLDGSVVPTALGINPLLTITALAERAVAHYARLQGWAIDDDATGGEPLPKVPGLPVVQPAPKADTVVRFSEKMTGSLELAPGCTAFAKLEVEFAEIGDIRKLLRTGPHRVKLERATLVAGGGKAVPVSGVVFWMERGRTNWFGRLLRSGWTWLCTRALSDFFQQRREGKAFQGKALGMAFKLASNVGEVRYLRYEMKLQSALMRGGTVVLPAKTRIRGLKTLEYARDANPWRQLSELKVTVTPPGGAPRAAGELKIDLAHMVRRFTAQLQVVRGLDLPTAIMDLASIGLFLARTVAKVHFWSFRLPEYEKHDPDRDRRRMPGVLVRLNLDRDTVFVAAKGGNLVLPLTRYRRDPAPGKPPVLLIHGFGSGGIQFAHPKLERNLARHLAEKGFDVWVAELRTSIALPESFNQWTLDEVAREDIPAIVERVLMLTGEKQLDVVAHCIGAAMFCTAALDGTLGQRVRSAVLLQVGPLITLSKGNEFRAYLAAALRRYMLANFMYSSVDSSATWRDAVLDRILSTYPYPESERPAHALCPPWKPNTHIANCNRSAGVFGRLFQHANVGDTMRDALGDLLGHTNLRTFEQTGKYAFAKRLTDYDGCNAYVTDENVGKHFNFPVRFLHGKQNDVFHPDTTAKSLEMLKRVFGPGHCADRIEFETYGHLDPLIGRNAETDVYGSISEFLEEAGRFSRGTPLVMNAYYAQRPLIGPLLGWTRKVKGGDGLERWTARIWCRSQDEDANARFIIAVVLDARGKPVPGHAFRGEMRDGQSAGARVPDRLAVVDVTLPDAPGDYEIVVVGAYAEVEAPPTQAQRGIAAAAEPAPRETGGADEKARRIAQAPTPGAPMDGYAKAVIEERAAWSKAMEQGTKARRVCDRGYEEQPDSVLLPRILLERLDSALAQPEFNFALGSCRYSATMIDREQADATFGRLRDLIENQAPGAPSLLLLAGDQIYADATAGLFDPKDRRARFYDAYREVWTAPNAREVLRRLPSYMMLDDHEVSDDWHPEDRGDQDYRDNRTWGLNAFEEYQLAHSPNNALALCAAAGVAPPANPAYFYAFEAGGYAFFACDTRTGRKGREQIMSGVQLAALNNWLRERQQDPGYASRPKFVLSPSVVVPFLKATRGSEAYAARSDGWDGFPHSLRELFSFIARERIDNVVFLCGDPHLSMSSEIHIEGNELPELRALCIVASPFYAPYPFANAKAEDFAATGAIPLDPDGAARMRYSRSPCVVGDSFTVVGVRPNGSQGWSVSASVHGRAGVTANPPFPLP